MDFKQKLNAIRKQISGNGHVNPPSDWEEEGIDHINIWPYAKSWLGRRLPMERYKNWQHPALGPFSSVEAIQVCARAKVPFNAYRTMKPHELRAALQNTGNFVGRGEVKNLNAVLLHSVFLRILSEPDLVKAIVGSDLPFDQYWCSYNEKNEAIRIQRRATATWVCAGYEEIRRALKDRRLPDFVAQMSHPKESLYRDVVRRMGVDDDADLLNDVDSVINGYALEAMTEVFEILDGKAKPQAEAMKKPKKKKKPASKVPSRYAVREEARAAEEAQAVSGLGMAGVVTLADDHEHAAKEADEPKHDAGGGLISPAVHFTDQHSSDSASTQTVTPVPVEEMQPEENLSSEETTAEIARLLKEEADRRQSLYYPPTSEEQLDAQVKIEDSDI